MKKTLATLIVLALSASTALADVPEDYARSEESTYLTFPEWFIVYSSEEYADFIQDQNPSEFPYLASAQQFWSSYYKVYTITKSRYGFNAGDHLMLWVIGSSFTAEALIKNAYEHTTGWASEWSAHNEKTEEDLFAYQYNQDYVGFIYDRPWYEFDFGTELKQLWTETPLLGDHMLRKWERRFALSLELGTKSLYAKLVGAASHGVYGIQPDTIYATSTSGEVIQIPRYRLFTETLPQLLKEGLVLHDIAGNETLFMTVLAPHEWDEQVENASVLFSMKILTDPTRKRVGISASVGELQNLLPSLEKEGVQLEHFYDY